MIGSLTVLYDADCPTCVRLQRWLVAQPQLVPLQFVAAGSPEARRRFVGLDHEATLRQITVIADDGSIYRKDRAMLVCLWALARWRGVALHAASPVRRPFVKLAAAGLDRWRRRAPGNAYRGGDVAPPPFDRFGGTRPWEAQRCDAERCGPGGR